MARPGDGLSFKTCLLINTPAVGLEKNHYSLGDIGDISHDKCKCAYAIGWVNATNKTTTYMYVTRLFDELRP